MIKYIQIKKVDELNKISGTLNPAVLSTPGGRDGMKCGRGYH
jgi:hypothetical protein